MTPTAVRIRPRKVRAVAWVAAAAIVAFFSVVATALRGSTGAGEAVFQPGDQVSYYVAGRGRNVVVNEQARLAGEWDPARPDKNVEHYQGKVLEIWDRFRRFTDIEGLVPYRDERDVDEAQLSLF